MTDTTGWSGLSGGERWRMAGGVAAAVAFRWLCFAGMILLSLLAEARPAPRVPDLIIDRVPYQPFVNDWNYWLWLAAYVPMGLALLATGPRRFMGFMITGGILSLLRGGCILLTGLGPVNGPDLNPFRLAEPGAYWTAFRELVDPFGVFGRHSAHLYLTKDLFFSGHAATTFNLLLWVWPWPRLRAPMAVLHVVVVASLFLAHLHYSIDVVGAWAITFAVYALYAGFPGLRRRAATAGSSPS